jgi:hypothetical protein
MGASKGLIRSGRATAAELQVLLVMLAATEQLVMLAATKQAQQQQHGRY